MSNLPKREFLMLAKIYQPDRMTVGGWYISEKLSGVRVFWDGGISRGFPTLEIPWANVINPKTGKMKKRIKPLATGLWSRYGNPIIAPDWFLNLLPCIPLDGNIWAGRGNFQLCRSICIGNIAGPNWDKAEFAVFGCPPIDKMFSDGEIKNTNMKMKLFKSSFDLWLKKHEEFNILEDWKFLETGKEKITFEQELATLREAIPSEGRIYLLQQRHLSFNVKKAAKEVEYQLEKILQLGGEGVILRNPNSCWEPKRTEGFLKYKPFKNDEGIIIGFTSSHKIDKRSYLLGKIGTLILDYKGKQFELSGIIDEERGFETAKMRNFAAQYPGCDMPHWFNGYHFKVGDRVTFRYRELNDDGIPKEARYWRK
jgi:DNA ligase-1